MAYKFRVGPAVLSGSTKLEEVLELAGGLKFSGSIDTAVAVGSDSILFRDSDGSVKTDTFADLATAFAGDGLAASSGVLAVGVDDSTVELNSDAVRVKASGITEAHLNTSVAGVGLSGGGGSALAVDLNELSAADLASGDFLAFVDSTDSNKTRKESIDDVATLLAGTGIAASSAVLSVDLNELSAAAVNVGADSIAIIDADDSNGSKKESIADLMTAVAGDGLAASSGVLAVGVDDSTVELNSDALRVKAAGITQSHLNTSVAGLGLSGGGGSALALDFSELVDEAIASGDRLAFRDATDDGMHAETVDDLATLFAGAGLSAASAVLNINTDGAMRITSDKVAISGSIAGSGLTFSGSTADAVDSLSLDLSNLGAGAIQAGDTFAFKDSNDSDKTKAESVDDLATLFAGVGLSATSAVMAVDLNELGAAAVDVTADSIAIIDANDSNATKKESIADLAVAMAGTGIGPNAGQFILDLSELSAAAVNVGADSIAIIDADDSNGSKKESIADLMTAVAGNGIAAASGVLSLDASEVSAAAIASGDHFVFHDITDDSTKKETVDDLATFMAGPGLGASSGELSIDLNELGAATVDVANDSVAIIDATDNTSKKEAIADIVGAMAGSGLVAASGVLSTRMDVTTAGDANYNAAFGLNINTANYTQARTVTLPSAAAGDAGRMLIIKARNAGTHALTVARNGSDFIDGNLTSLVIESDNGAVTLLCASAGNWIIV